MNKKVLKEAIECVEKLNKYLDREEYWVYSFKLEADQDSISIRFENFFLWDDQCELEVFNGEDYIQYNMLDYCKMNFEKYRQRIIKIDLWNETS